jgi:hypothetical protein
MLKEAVTVILLVRAVTLTFEAFAEERWRIYDQKGRYEGSVRQDGGGRMKMCEWKGQYQSYIEDGRVCDRDGTLGHRIVPRKKTK